MHYFLFNTNLYQKYVLLGEVTMNLGPGKKRRITPEGEPPEDTGGGGRFPGGGRGGFFRRGSGRPGIGKCKEVLFQATVSTL